MGNEFGDIDRLEDQHGSGLIAGLVQTARQEEDGGRRAARVADKAGETREVPATRPAPSVMCRVPKRSHPRGALICQTTKPTGTSPINTRSRSGEATR